MNKELWKAVVKQFEVQMAIVLPSFARSKAKVVDRRVYAWNASDKLVYYVELVRAAAYNKFTIDLAWSIEGQNHGFIYFNTDPIAALQMNGALIRMGMLWDQ